MLILASIASAHILVVFLLLYTRILETVSTENQFVNLTFDLKEITESFQIKILYRTCICQIHLTHNLLLNSHICKLAP